MKSKIHNLFPSIVQEIDIENFSLVKKRVTSYIYKEREKFPESVVKSNRGGWQSESTYCNYDNILRNIVSGGLSLSSKIYKSDKKLALGSLWININGKGDYNVMHNHPNCDFSGVLWIKTPPDCGIIKFESPHSLSLIHISEPTRPY